MPAEIPKLEIAVGIERLGYHVITGDAPISKKTNGCLKAIFNVFFLHCFYRTLNVASDTGLHIHWLMDPYVQLTNHPVFLVGMDSWQKRHQKVWKGIPNMNVLIAGSHSSL